MLFILFLISLTYANPLQKGCMVQYEMEREYTSICNNKNECWIDEDIIPINSDFYQVSNRCNEDESCNTMIYYRLFNHCGICKGTTCHSLEYNHLFTLDSIYCGGSKVVSTIPYRESSNIISLGQSGKTIKGSNHPKIINCPFLYT